MPTMYWTQAEHDAAMKVVEDKSMALAQALCKASGGHCIRGPDGRGRGDGEYCDICVSEPNCPEQFKSYSR